MLNRIEPLRNELASLEHEAQENRTKNEEMQKLIKELEHSIAKYKEEYAILISQAQAIKADLAAVEAKVSVINNIKQYLMDRCNILEFTGNQLTGTSFEYTTVLW